MKLSIRVSFSDHAVTFGTWGKVGVWHILDRCASSGFNKVYWRMGSGQQEYPSKVATPLTRVNDQNNCYLGFQKEGGGVGAWGYNPEAYKWWNKLHDFSQFDAPGYAVERARQIGLEIASWTEVNAETHGHGMETDFLIAHPDWRSKNRSGKHVLGRVSWAVPECIDYRLRRVRESFQYGFDAVQLDFIKGGDHRIAMYDKYGVRQDLYDDHVVEAFRQDTGRDPFRIPNDDEQWVRFRAAYVTDFLRQARRMQKAEFSAVALSSYGQVAGEEHFSSDSPSLAPDFYPYDKMKRCYLREPLYGNFEDHTTWTSEGLIDGMCFCMNPTKAVHSEQIPGDETFRRRLDGCLAGILGDQTVALQFYAYGKNKVEDIVRIVCCARELDCDEVSFNESCPIERLSAWPDYAKAFSSL